MASLQHFSAFLTCGGIRKICNYYTFTFHTSDDIIHFHTHYTIHIFWPVIFYILIYSVPGGIISIDIPYTQYIPVIFHTSR